MATVDVCGSLRQNLKSGLKEIGRRRTWDRGYCTGHDRGITGYVIVDGTTVGATGRTNAEGFVVVFNHRFQSLFAHSLHCCRTGQIIQSFNTVTETVRVIFNDA